MIHAYCKMVHVDAGYSLKSKHAHVLEGPSQNLKLDSADVQL